MITETLLIVSWVGSFLSSPSKTCIMSISSKPVPIPSGISDSDRNALIGNGIKQLRQRVQGIKDTIYALLLVTMGGLATLSFLLLGDLITLGAPDLALQISLSAFAVALPLLAASYWNLRIWHAIPVPWPTTRVHRDTKAGNEIQEDAVLSTKLSYMQLLTIVPAAIITFAGVVSALWHVFWIAGIVFLAAVILGCSFIALSSVQHLRVFISSQMEIS